MRQSLEMSAEHLFATERLEARRLQAEDAVAMHAIFGDGECMRYVDDGEIMTAEQCRSWIVDVTDRNFEMRGYGLIGFWERTADKLVGCGGLFHPNQQEQAEVMYWLVRDCWGKGLATEIVRSLVQFAKPLWGVETMIATIHPDNLASQRVVAKVGFQRLADRTEADGECTQVWALGH